MINKTYEIIEQRKMIDKVNRTRSIVSSKLSSLTFIEEKMRRLAGDENNDKQWAALEKEFNDIVQSYWTI
jgi:hypothetical protein